MVFLRIEENLYRYRNLLGYSISVIDKDLSQILTLITLYYRYIKTINCRNSIPTSFFENTLHIQHFTLYSNKTTLYLFYRRNTYTLISYYYYINEFIYHSKKLNKYSAFIFHSIIKIFSYLEYQTFIYHEGYIKVRNCGEKPQEVK